MKVLITGGAGYVGSELAFELVKNSEVEQIIIYDNLSRKNYNFFTDTRYSGNKLRFIQGEILDSRLLKETLKDVDVVYHLAAKVSSPLTHEDSHLFEQINHWGTAELVYAVEESNVSQFIYLSSSNVYGTSDKEIDINYIPNPTTFYGSSKLRGEAHVERLIPKVKTHIIRSSSVFGFSPSTRYDQVINQFMFDANFKGQIHITGSGNHIRSFIHINKLVNVLHNLVINKKFPSGTYNLVGKNMSFNKIAGLISNLYPQLEMLYVNQHLSLKDLRIKHDERVEQLITMPPQSIEEDLAQLKAKFSFFI